MPFTNPQPSIQTNETSSSSRQNAVEAYIIAALNSLSAVDTGLQADLTAISEDFYGTTGIAHLGAANETGTISGVNGDLVITANNTTDTFSANKAHGLIAGQPVELLSSGTLPGGVSASTTYYAGALASTTFKLYDTAPNAITGGATGLINLSSDGTGTLNLDGTLLFGTGTNFTTLSSNSYLSVLNVGAASSVRKMNGTYLSATKMRVTLGLKETFSGKSFQIAELFTSNKVVTPFGTDGLPIANTSNSYYCGAQYGTGNAHVISAPVATLTAGSEFTYTTTLANTDAVTCQIGTNTPLNIRKAGNTPLLAGDIIANTTVTVTYNGTHLELKNPTIQDVNSFANPRKSFIEYNDSGSFKILAGFATVDKTMNASIYMTADKTVSLSASGANGLDAGSEAANTWYYLWAIRKSADGTTAGLWSLSSSAPTMPSGYDQKAFTGVAVRNDATSNILPIRYTPDGWHMYTDVDMTGTYNQVLNAGSATSYTAVVASSYAPPLSRLLMVTIHLNHTSTGAAFAYIRQTGSLEQLLAGGSADTYRTFGDKIIGMDGSQNFDYKVGASIQRMSLHVRGYKVDTL